MRNPIVRIMRSLDESFGGPEYACNLLVAEIVTNPTLDTVHEWSLRVYSTRYQLLGCDVWQKPRDKKLPRKIRLRLVSDRYWEEERCHLFLYGDGRPRWYASFPLTAGYGKWIKVELEAMSCHPDELFFVERLSYQSWWCRLEQGRFAPATIRDLITKLRLRATDPAPTLHWVVEGDKRQASAFASGILAACLTDGAPKACCRFALNDLLSGGIGWSTLRSHLSGKKAVVVQVERIGDNDSAENLLDLLAEWLKSPEAIPFIFYGSEKNVEILLQYIPALGDQFEEERSIFHLAAPQPDTLSNDNEKAHLPLPDEAGLCDLRLTKGEQSETACEALDKLEKLIGLSRVKADLRDVCLMARFTQERRAICLDSDGENRYHMIFYGNPGTGKTTVARLMGEIYHHMGLLSKGHTVETCRAELVGEFIGQTENRTKEILEQARGGVLFIDEAYTLAGGRTRESNDFGKEVIHALLSILSEPNPDMIVILAGYEEKMQLLLQSNPGLRDRFPLQFRFDDFSAEELHAIACQRLQSREFILTCEADQRLAEVIGRAVACPDPNFGNGRWVHNLVEQGIVKSMARRIMSMPSHDCTDRELMSTITVDDIDRAEQRMLELSAPHRAPMMRIGFRA
ncbi:AAA family ATPase [Barnesiella viscericola]|uniref:AAA family ATPase n=1 Tax=Barnesiella viscericola TaxID=397865 RepID=UPI0024B71BBB|nr:AAA family ATPase [Barnesiella viscericola]